MSEHPATMPGEREEHPVRTAPRWGMSPLDCKAHAIDENAEHPYGVYIARCGHRLLMGTTLHNEAPGWMCLSCLRWSEQPHPQREEDEDEHVTTRVTDHPRTPALAQVPVQGTRTHDGAACTLLAIRETGGTWVIHSLARGAVWLTEGEAVRMATVILHLVGGRADHTARAVSEEIPGPATS